MFFSGIASIFGLFCWVVYASVFHAESKEQAVDSLLWFMVPILLGGVLYLIGITYGGV